MNAGLKIKIDRDECIQCASCWSVCPDIFEEAPDDGFSQIVETYRIDTDSALGIAPEDLRNCATEAAESCPVEIIHLQ
jgi:ferredoxin